MSNAICAHIFRTPLSTNPYDKVPVLLRFINASVCAICSSLWRSWAVLRMSRALQKLCSALSRTTVGVNSNQISQAGVEVSDGLGRSVDGHAREGGRTACADERGRLLTEWNLNGLFGLLLIRTAHPSGETHHVNVELARL